MKKNKKNYIQYVASLLILYIIGGHTPLHAFTRIYGQVVDSITLERIPYVSVYLQNTTYGCPTDKDGHFSFVMPDNQGTLVVSSVGYNEKRIPIYPDTSYPL